MFLKKIKNKSGRVRLAVYESYWDIEAAKSKQRSVRSLGFVDELEKEHDEPLALAKSIVDQMNAEREAQTHAVQIKIHPQQLVAKYHADNRNAGAAVVCAVYDGLGIEAAIRDYVRERELTYDLNAVLRLLVVERIVGSGSLRDAWEGRSRHFFRSDFTVGDVEYALGELACCKDRICAAMDRSIEKAGTGGVAGQGVVPGADARARLPRLGTRPELSEIKKVLDVDVNDPAASGFSWTPECAEAHALVCHIALTILRLLRRATGVREANICKELSLMNCSALDDDWWLFAHRTDASDRLDDDVGLPVLTYRYLSTADMRAIFDRAGKFGLPREGQS